MANISANPLFREFDEFNKKEVVESHTNDEAHVVGLIDKEGHHWMHRTDLSRNEKHAEHTSKYSHVYKDASPGYLANSNRVRSAWHNTTTDQVHEGSPFFGGRPESGVGMSPNHGGKFAHISHFNVHKEKKD